MRKLSHVGRKIFEHKRTSSALGEILALAAVFVGLFSPSVSAFSSPRPSLEVLAVEDNLLAKTEPLELRFPIENGRVSQGFHLYHPGIDIAAEVGTPIYSVTQGVVLQVGFDFRGLGRIVIVDHGSGFTSLYAHLKNAEVEIGQEVDAKTMLGRVGLTGRTTGAHLHLELQEDGRYLNPAEFLSREQI